MAELITPVLLCGGSGSRLWPVSRKSYPKQFVPLIGKESLFQASARRLSDARFDVPMVMTSADYRFVVTEQLAEIDVRAGDILIEPDGRNTAPAILAAALRAAQTDPDQLLLVAPSDHVIPNWKAFYACIDMARDAASDGRLVTFGIVPTRPETGYGYLQLEKAAPNNVVPLRRFVEKPDELTAAQMVLSGNYMWNAGIFLFTARAVIDAFRDHAGAMFDAVNDAVINAKRDLDFLRLSAEHWSNVNGTSIDYAVMEKATNLSVVPFHGGWSDLGDWEAVWRDGVEDADGNVTRGSAVAMECANSLLRSDVAGQQVVGLGLENVVAIAMPDAVLIADKSRAQEVKRVVTKLRDIDAPQAETLPRDFRPWGWFESLALGDKFQVKRIVVNPGGCLSLQSHRQRSEHWVVVSGAARVTIDDTVKSVGENQSVYIPVGARHRMENPGDAHLILIEVQTGTYFGEDDIVRYDDIYARV